MTNLVSVFIDTERICKKDETLQTAINNTVKNQYIVSENNAVKPVPQEHRFKKPADVIVSPKRSFQAAMGYPDKKVCVLNFASSTHPGGGVRTGASAQEECLCRCSTLYFALSEQNTYQNFHKKHQNLLRQNQMNSLYNDDCIFSPDIVILKSDDGLYTPLPRNMRPKVDVITCAAPNLRFMPPSITDKKTRVNNEKLKDIHQKRAKRILDIAKSEKEDVIILGAFGCGAFSNPPDVVSQAWAEVLKDYLFDFETIEFAVISKPDKPSKNFLAFKNTIEKTF